MSAKRALSGFVLLLSVIMAVGCSRIPDLTLPPETVLHTGKLAKFAYTGNQGASLSGYLVDSASGALTPLSGFPLSVGANPTVITHDPLNRFVIVGDIAASQLRVFSINSTTGALTPTATYNTISEPVALTVDPLSRYLFVAGQGTTQIGAYALNANGTLAAATGSPFSTGGSSNMWSIGSECIKTDSLGAHVYVQDSANIYTFNVGSGGALTLVQTVAQPGRGLALDPAGGFLYTINPFANTIVSYTIGSNGQLTLASTSHTAGSGAYTLAVSPTGQFAYSIENTSTLVAYAITGAGVFTTVGTIQGIIGEQIAVDPSGSFVYVPMACSQNCPGGVYNVVNEFAIEPGGTLKALANSVVAAGVTPWGITVTTQ